MFQFCFKTDWASWIFKDKYTFDFMMIEINQILSAFILEIYVETTLSKNEAFLRYSYHRSWVLSVRQAVDFGVNPSRKNLPNKGLVP